MKPAGIALSVALLLFAGCGESRSEAKKIETPAAVTVEKSQSVAPAPKPPEKKAAEAPAPAATEKAATPAAKGTASAPGETAKVSAFYAVFKDGAKIAPDGKPLLLVFGQPTDPYTQKFQKDVTEDKELALRIKETLTPIYVNAAAAKVHKFMHEGDLMDVDTRTLVSIYGVDATPTMIFMDEQGKSIFVVPGYMPPKQFKVTLDFVKEGAYKGKDRKNGEVYEALKAYYLAHGVAIKGADKRPEAGK